MPAARDPILYELGSRARARRKELGIRSADLAEQIDIDYALLLRLERALYSIPRPDLESRWEMALNVPIGWLRTIPPELFKLVEKPILDLSDCDTLAAAIRRVSFALTWPHVRMSTTALMVKDKQERNSEMFAERYGVLGLDKTLQTIGDRHGMTRERVRQITDKMLDRSQHITFDIPVLERLYEAAQPLLPSTVSRLDTALAGLLGESLSTFDANRFSREVLGKPLFNITDTPGEVGKKWEMTIYDPINHEPEEVSALRQSSLAMIRSCGAANFHYVVGEASALTGKAIASQDALKAIQLVNHFEWLVEEDGWFWFGMEQPLENRAITVCRKVLSVATSPVDVEDLLTAMVRSRRPRSEPRLKRVTLVELPMRVLVALLERVPVFRTVQYDDFVLNEKIDPETVLSESEFLIYQCLLRHGGVATKSTIMKETMAATSLQDITFHLGLSTSPIIARLSKGIYTIRGRDVDAHRYLQAQLLTHNVNGYARRPLVLDETGWVESEVCIQPSSLAYGYFDISNSLGKALGDDGKSYLCQGNQVSLIARGNYHRLGGMVSLLRSMGIKAGDVVRLRAQPEAGIMEVIPVLSPPNRMRR